MKTFFKYIILFQLLQLSSCKSKDTVESQLKLEVDMTGLQFKYTDFNKAKKRAKELNKHILIYVTADGCGPCLKMEKEVFSDSTIKEFFNKEIICGKIHIKRRSVMKSSEFDKLNETQLDFLDFHNIESGFPTFLIFDNDGNLFEKTTKYMDSDEFIKFGEKVLKLKSTSGNNV